MKKGRPDGNRARRGTPRAHLRDWAHTRARMNLKKGEAPMPASERGLAKAQGARKAKIKKRAKKPSPLDSTAQTGRQADNGQGRNHRGVEEGRQTHRGEREKKNGRAAGKRPENAGIKNRGAKTQARKRIENCALPFSGENRGNRSRRLAPRQRRRAREGGKNKSANPCRLKSQTKSARDAGARTAETRPRLGAQHPPPQAQQRCGAAALVYGSLHGVWAAAC